MVPDLSIVIPSRKDDKGLYLTLAAAHENARASGIRHEIIVVGDGGCGIRPDILFPDTRVVKGQFGSPARARDAGMALANAPLIAVLDSHVGLGTGTLQRLMDAVRGGTVLAAPAQKNSAVPGNRPCTYYELRLRWDDQKVWHGGHWREPVVADRPYEAGFLSLSCHVISAQFYSEVRGVVRDLPYGPEEVILPGLGWLAGKSTMMVPNALFYHYDAENRRTPGESDFTRIGRLIRERLNLLAVRRVLTERGIRT
jgi:hypothetical protein